MMVVGRGWATLVLQTHQQIKGRAPPKKRGLSAFPLSHRNFRPSFGLCIVNGCSSEGVVTVISRRGLHRKSNWMYKRKEETENGEESFRDSEGRREGSGIKIDVDDQNLHHKKEMEREHGVTR